MKKIIQSLINEIAAAKTSGKDKKIIQKLQQKLDRIIEHGRKKSNDS